MSPRPLLLFVAALALVCAGIAAGIALFSDARAEATHDRLVVEAYSLAHDAIAWSQTPTILGGGEGTDALARLSLASLSATPQRDAEGEYVRSAGSTLRFRDLDTDVPVVEACDEAGQVVVRLAILGPHAACVVAIEDTPEPGQAPDACVLWTIEA